MRAHAEYMKILGSHNMNAISVHQIEKAIRRVKNKKSAKHNEFIERKEKITNKEKNNKHKVSKLVEFEHEIREVEENSFARAKIKKV